jgi:hypothetical protein
MQFLIWFVIIFFSLLFVSTAFLLVFLLGRKTVKNNIKNAIVLVKLGNDLQGFKGKLHGNPSKLGYRYNYNDNKNIVLVPKKYKELYHKNRRMIFLNGIGELVSVPFDDKEKLSDKERNELIYELLESHIGSDIVRAMNGKTTMNIWIIAVIAFIVGVVLVFGFNFVKDNMNKNKELETNNQPTTTQDINTLPQPGIQPKK